MTTKTELDAELAAARSDCEVSAAAYSRGVDLGLPEGSLAHLLDDVVAAGRRVRSALDANHAEFLEWLASRDAVST